MRVSQGHGFLHPLHPCLNLFNDCIILPNSRKDWFLSPQGKYLEVSQISQFLSHPLLKKHNTGSSFKIHFISSNKIQIKLPLTHFTVNTLIQVTIISWLNHCSSLLISLLTPSLVPLHSIPFTLTGEILMRADHVSLSKTLWWLHLNHEIPHHTRSYMIQICLPLQSHFLSLSLHPLCCTLFGLVAVP